MDRSVSKALETRENPQRFPLRVHPRAFSALGADLVTSDIVAVMELVKNSYDALATEVHIRFTSNADSDPYLEVKDNGCGMTKAVIENVWCLVATPNKEKNHVVTNRKHRRRVSGQKGLGRLSSARLGDRLRMVTQSMNGPCLEVTIDWAKIFKGDDLSDVFVTCKPYTRQSPFKFGSGTRLRIYRMRAKWDDNRIFDLEQNLCRLISPFYEANNFKIFLSDPGSKKNREIEILAPDFLNNPKYCLRGISDKNGNIKAKYSFSPLDRKNSRKNELSISWHQIFDNISERSKAESNLHSDMACCGPFEFEIRAWDLSSEDNSEISQRFDISKGLIRKSINAQKGISVYRDKILVLPKSDTARDWLGLDLRRVSRLGTRLSTSQIVGYVSISADINPGIRDTSDREKLISSRESVEFVEILKAVIGRLEQERDEDRSKPSQQRPLRDLFSDLDATNLVEELRILSTEGRATKEVVTAVDDFKKFMDSARKEVMKRFIYYSHLATIGTIANMLVHEIGTRTTLIGRFLIAVKDSPTIMNDRNLRKKFHRAERSVDALEKLSDTFSPLANRRFRRRNRRSILEERISICLQLLDNEIKSKHVSLQVPNSVTELSVDPAELDAILLNLVTNSLYWFTEVSDKARELVFKVEEGEDSERIIVVVRDTGPGISEVDTEKVFWPGVTRKPGGIGMGLTVAAELVATYGGRMGLEVNDTAAGSGACFKFDLPLFKPR